MESFLKPNLSDTLKSRKVGSSAATFVPQLELCSLFSYPVSCLQPHDTYVPGGFHTPQSENYQTGQKPSLVSSRSPLKGHFLMDTFLDHSIRIYALSTSFVFLIVVSYESHRYTYSYLYIVHILLYNYIFIHLYHIILYVCLCIYILISLLPLLLYNFHDGRDIERHLLRDI